MALSESNKDISFLEESFPELDFKLFDTKTAAPINCFVCSGNTNVTLLKYWSNITGCIAAEFQAKLNDRYLAWNIYLIFLCIEPIEKSLKYKIENDKFSLRKLIVDSANHQDDLGTLLNNEILGHDLKLLDEKEIQETDTEYSKTKLQVTIESFEDISSGSKDEIASLRLKQLDQLLSLVNKDED